MWWAPMMGRPRESLVLVERENVEAEVDVLVHAGVVIRQLEAGVQRDFPSSHEPCRCLSYP